MLHITNHSGKLEGLRSISSCVALNPYCKERAKNPATICHHCYATRYVGMRDALRRHLECNTNELQALIEWDELPIIADVLFRFESFGDTLSATHAGNYYRIAAKNVFTTFAAWTKNVEHYETAHETICSKPDNFILIYSDPVLNGHSDAWYEAFFEAHPLVDKIFVVMDKDHADGISCGKRKCKACLLCYTKSGARIIREVLK